MEISVDDVGFGFTNGSGDIFKRCLLYALEGFEGLHECGTCGGTDAGYTVELGDYLSLGTTVAMMRDTETVGFIA